MRNIVSLAAALVVGLLLALAADARAEPGVLIGSPPLVRVSWSAVRVADGVVHAPSTAVILRSGGVTLLETYDGSPFLLRQFAGRPDSLKVLTGSLARNRVFALDGTVCSSLQVFGLLGPDRAATAVPGAPLTIHWYNVNGRRTADIEVRAEPGFAPCSNDVQSIIGAVFTHLQFSANSADSPPTFVTGFASQAGALREVTGRVFCGSTSTATPARVRLYGGLPYQCFPEVCLPSNVPVLAETTTGPDGRFRLTIPAAASPDLYLHAERSGGSCAFEFTQARLPDRPIDSVELRLLFLYNPEG